MEIDTVASDKLSSIDAKALTKINETLRGHEASLDAHVVKSLVGVNENSSNKIDSEQIISSFLTTLDPKINDVIIINFNLQCPTFLQSTNSKVSQCLQSENQDLSKSIEVVNNRIIAISKT